MRNSVSVLIGSSPGQNAAELKTLIPRTSSPRLRISSSVVRKYIHSYIRVHYVILTRRPLEDSTVVGWQEKIVDQPTCGGVPHGRGSRYRL